MRGDECRFSAGLRALTGLARGAGGNLGGAAESEDHAADEWRYACMSRPFVPVPVARTRSVPDVGYAALRSAAPADWKLF